jgi:phenylpropionate dioxygenase-like ring-hydroxylating dioxygenase large terminal subunit
MMLNEQQMEAVTAPLGQAQTLPPIAYTSPALFEQECKSIFYKEWVCVARVDQVPNPGDYLRVDIIKQPLILVRQPDHSLHAMSAICAHRGMPIVKESGNASHFQCPYHLWRYDSLGKLVNKPLMDGVAVPDDCQLPAVLVETWQGFVFVNLDVDAAPLAPRLDHLEDVIAPYNMQDMVWVSSSEWVCPWNWKILVDNFMEAYHHLGPHSQSIQPTNAASDSFSTGEVQDGWSVLHMPAREAGAKGDALASIVMPSFCWLNIPGEVGAFWYQLLPTAHNQMTLVLHTLLPRAIANSSEGAAAAEGMQKIIDNIHEEDIAVNSGPWAGVNSPLAQQGFLSQLEKSIWLFNQWWLERMQSPG